MTSSSDLANIVEPGQAEDSYQNQIRRTVDRIVQLSRLKELKKAVKEIQDENAVIIEGLHKSTKAIKKNSKFRGVSKNGKKWQVMVMGNMRKYYSGSI